MRNISFSMTTPQFIDGTKDVTRRFGWWDLKPGDRLMAVEKAMGLKKGQKMKRLGMIEIISVRRELLNTLLTYDNYGHDELRREGYPFGLKDPHMFVLRLLRETKKNLLDEINRIEFIKLEDLKHDHPL